MRACDALRVIAPFLDPSDGSVSVAFEEQDTEAMLAALTRALPAGTTIDTKGLRIARGRVTTASAYCTSERARLSFARRVSVEPSRVLMFFEEHAIVELQ